VPLTVSPAAVVRSMPRLVAVVEPSWLRIVRPTPAALFLMTKWSPSTVAVTSTPVAELIAVITSFTVETRDRSTIALPPLESAIWIFPRTIPCPPLNDARSISRSRRPSADSSVSDEIPAAVVARSVNPRVSTCCVLTRRSTRKVYEPIAAPVEAVADRASVSVLDARAEAKVRCVPNADVADFSALRRELTSR